MRSLTAIASIPHPAAHVGHFDESELRGHQNDSELLRHSNYQMTADTYTHAVTPIKRAAQTKPVRIILPAKLRQRGASEGWIFQSLNFIKSFGLLASPTGFEPVLPP
jgi:hypothetical protein